MNKIFLIIEREYLSRVKKKSFIVLTFLVPVLFMGMIALIGYISANGDEFGGKKIVRVVDESGLFKNKIKNSSSLHFVFETGNYAAAKADFIKSEDDYLLHIPASLNGVELVGNKKPSLFSIEYIGDQLTDVAQAHRLQVAGIDSTVLAKAESRVKIDAKQITENGEKDAGSSVASGIGFAGGLLIYLALFLYGAQVMRGVIEEKTSRIIEVIISSVKPFQLMLGKIIGVGLVGLTQFVLWIGLTIALTTVAASKMQTKAHARVEITSGMSSAPTPASATLAAQQNDGGAIMQSLQNIPIAYILGCFLFYFLFGYLLYSAIFAAVGSAVDSETETQQFMLPVTLPLIFTYMLSMTVIVVHPDSPLSVWLSVIPFTSPIAMMVRIPFGVPAWQLALSMLMMILGFIFTTWVASRIYRVGILMYGKKASYKELAKWFTYKE